MTPTIGRIVHVTGGGGSTQAAIIVGICHPTNPDAPRVDVAIFTVNGTFYESNVPYSSTPVAFHWSWPPKV